MKNKDIESFLEFSLSEIKKKNYKAAKIFNEIATNLVMIETRRYFSRLNEHQELALKILKQQKDEDGK